jgi:hypothetical protein
VEDPVYIGGNAIMKAKASYYAGGALSDAQVHKQQSIF